MKKLISLLLALIMVLSIGATAFAAPDTTLGTITINDALPGEEYSIYRIFDLESFSGDLYSYKLNADWANFRNDSFFTVDANGYILWHAEDTQTAAAEFAGIAIDYAKNNGIAPVATATARELTADEVAAGTKYVTVEFKELALGYYLVDTTLGALCSLNTTNYDAIIEEKNEEPPVEKVVKEDSTGDYGQTNTADYGEVVDFQSTITVKAGTENYVLHDKMSDNLELDANSFTVKVDGADVDAENYTIKVFTDEEKAAEGHDGCTFEIEFENGYILGLDPDTQIIVAYQATVVGGAPVYTGIPNETKLTYGKESESTWSATETKTYGFEVFKYSGDNVALEGAKFVIYKTVDGVNKYATADADGNLTGWVDTEEAATKFVSDEYGFFEIKGIDADTYQVKEVEAPAGYNLIVAPFTVVINEDGTVTVDNGPAKNEKGNAVLYEVSIENKAGALLPSTGGIGTTIFYVVGGALMLGAAVLLISKRRMGNN